MSSTPPTNSTGSSAPLQDEHDALPAGTRLAEFEILRVLGVGGFGIVYLAMDHALDRLVAVKEYMPSMMAARGRGTEVSLRSSLHQDTFNIGLRSFVNEAKLLARFNHSSLVKVYRFWEANGTAYMAMPFYPGRTLKEERRAMLTVPDEAWLRGIIDPLLGAMEVLHKENVYHRDIAPDNILLLPDGPPVLLDFGAARSVIGDRTQSLTAVLKPSYAPIEQYADVGHLRQGPWTDLYALGAVMHFVVTGRPPTPSASRAVHDDQRPLATLGADITGTMPPQVLKAIDWALTVSPHTRPQSVQQFRDALDGKFMPPDPVVAPQSTLATEPSRAAPTAWDRTVGAGSAGDVDVDLDMTVVTAPVPLGGATIASTTASTTAHTAATAASAPIAAATGASPPKAPTSPAPPAPDTRPRTSRALPPLFDGADGTPDATTSAAPSRALVWLGAFAVLLVVIVGLVYAMVKPGSSDPVPVAPPAPAPMSATPAPAPAPAQVPAPVTAVPRIAPPTTPVPTDVAPVPTPPPAPAPAASVFVPNWSTRPTTPAATASAATAAPAASDATVAPRAAAPARPKAPRAAAGASAAASPASPRDTCARDGGSLANCMRRLCTNGPWVDHPQCVQLRRDDAW